VASIVTDQGILHFEVYGKGKPVILLPGWLGSWELWQDTMAFLGQYYRAYAIDFWSSSESGRKRIPCGLNDLASLVSQFIDQMGIVKALLVGHGLGGTVCLLTALANPQRVERAAVISAPLNRAGLRLRLRLAARRPFASWLPSAFRLTRAFLRRTAPALCRDPRLAEMMTRDLSPEILRSFVTSLASLGAIDLREDLKMLSLPVLGMYADRDKIVLPRQWKIIRSGVTGAQILRYPQAGHFIMLDEPRACMQSLKKFLDQSEENPHE
jgi:pimeloyl-ACP methyl ester carboxylesterase